jgi:hypothetical protein
MERETVTRIERFAEQYRLKVTRDECNDQVIQGRRGQLYFDGEQLCLMVLDGAPAIRSKWAALGGKLWTGEISPNAKGRRVQDVKITGIPLANARLAIRMARIKPKRVMSEAQKAVLDKARSLLPRPPQRPREPVESFGLPPT